MPCAQHVLYYDNCAPCRSAEAQFDAAQRHKQRMRQSQRHHDQRMNAARRVSAAGVAAAGGAGIGVGGMLLVVLLVVLSVMAAIAISVLSVAFAVLTVLVQGLFAAVVFGGVAAAITYGIKRSKTPDARFQFEKPAASVPARERAAAAYRGLDPVTQSAVKVGAIAAATGFLLSVLF